MGKSTASYKCPADIFVSSAQVKAGVIERARSYSMSSFFGLFSQCPSCGGSGTRGSGTDYTYQGYNQFNNTANGGFANYRQFIKLASVTKPSWFYLMLDEHPDSINDGYYDVGNLGRTANSLPVPGTWGDLPASYHNRAAGFSFADGHSEIHKWLDASTAQPVKFIQLNGLSLTGTTARSDIIWAFDHAGTR
jgi:prepilin-type processing-associated H-X9-DG protein